MKICIPPIEGKRLRKLAKTIRPIVRFNGVQHFIEPCHPRNIAFQWNPKKAAEAKNLTRLCDVTTYHTFGYYGFFKPTIAEVLAQIPTDVIEQVCAFEIVSQPDSAEHLNKNKEALNQGFHVATTRLYSKSK